MKTQYYTASSLDGFIAGPNDSLDWLFPFGDVDETSYPQFIREVGALTMESATYKWMLRHLGGSDPPQPWPYEQTACTLHAAGYRFVTVSELLRRGPHS